MFTLGSALCGLAPSVDLLVAGRFIQGSGAAAMLPASLGLLLGAFPDRAPLPGGGPVGRHRRPGRGHRPVPRRAPRLRPRLAVGVLRQPAHRRRRLPGRTAGADGDDDGDSGARPDYAGVVLVSATLAALVLGITEGPTWGWSSGRIVACFVGAVVVGAAFLRRSARHPEPVLDLTLFRSRSFSVANAATVLYAMGFFAMLLGNILFLTSVWHYSILRAGLAVTPGPLVVAAVSGPAGRVAQTDRVPRRAARRVRLSSPAA